MALIKNVSPLGDLDVPALGLHVAAGATVEVSDEAAASLLEQTDVWAAGDSKKSTNSAAADPTAVKE